MTPFSYSDVFALDLDRDTLEDIRAGDRVRTGASAHPEFTVVAVDGDKAWLRETQGGADAVVKLTRCRKVA